MQSIEIDTQIISKNSLTIHYQDSLGLGDTKCDILKNHKTTHFHMNVIFL